MLILVLLISLLLFLLLLLLLLLLYHYYLSSVVWAYHLMLTQLADKECATCRVSRTKQSAGGSRWTILAGKSDWQSWSALSMCWSPFPLQSPWPSRTNTSWSATPRFAFCQPHLLPAKPTRLLPNPPPFCQTNPAFANPTSYLSNPNSAFASPRCLLPNHLIAVEHPCRLSTQLAFCELYLLRFANPICLL